MLELTDVSHAYAHDSRALELRDVFDTARYVLAAWSYGAGSGRSCRDRDAAYAYASSISSGDFDILAQPEQRRRTLGYLP
jgi:hypothetical protein